MVDMFWLRELSRLVEPDVPSDAVTASPSTGSRDVIYPTYRTYKTYGYTSLYTNPFHYYLCYFWVRDTKDIDRVSVSKVYFY